MRNIWTLVFLFALSACVGTSQPARFYSLQAENLSGHTYPRQLSIGIEEFSIPSYLDKPQIVVRGDNGVELQPSELNRWSEPLAVMMPRILADDLSLLFPSALVKPRNFGRENFSYTVTVEVNRFDGTWDKTAVLDVWWNLQDKNGTVVYRRRSNLQQPLGKGYDNLAEVQSRLVAQLAADIAAAVNQRP